jgi:hypothetical protein
MKIYGYYQPYDADSDDVFAETGQYQVFLTFFTVLIIRNNIECQAEAANEFGPRTSIVWPSVRTYYQSLFDGKIVIFDDVEEYKNNIAVNSAGISAEQSNSAHHYTSSSNNMK